MGDYSQDTLNKARLTVAKHIDQCRFVQVDAINPIKSLAQLRHKILQVHLTNVYDNLPDEEVVRRDGKLYFVQVRAYVPTAAVNSIGGEVRCASRSFSAIACITCSKPGSTILGVARTRRSFLAGTVGGDAAGRAAGPARGSAGVPFPGRARRGPSSKTSCRTPPRDFRFHLSSGALESFIHTLPLLHPRGYLQVQDIFVTDMAQYRTGFFGPGKLDGSLLNWVNGALLKEVAQREGYNVHFRPFQYRADTQTSILYTTRRE